MVICSTIPRVVKFPCIDPLSLSYNNWLTRLINKSQLINKAYIYSEDLLNSLYVLSGDVTRKENFFCCFSCFQGSHHIGALSWHLVVGNNNSTTPAEQNISLNMNLMWLILKLVVMLHWGDHTWNISNDS